MFENNYFNTQENATAKSPFSVYAEENHKLILPEKRTSLDEIDFLLDKGYIGENEKLLLIITNNMCFATSRQLTQMFNLAGFNIDQAKTQSMLKKLKTKSFIKQVEFYNQSNESMKSSFRAYTLGQHGVGILYASQIKPKLQGYINAMSTSTIKKTLAVNQLIIAILSTIQVLLRHILWCLIKIVQRMALLSALMRLLKTKMKLISLIAFAEMMVGKRSLQTDSAGITRLLTIMILWIINLVKNQNLSFLQRIQNIVMKQKSLPTLILI